MQGLYAIIKPQPSPTVLQVSGWENFNFILHSEELRTECKYYYIQLCEILTPLNIKGTLDNTKRTHIQAKKGKFSHFSKSWEGGGGAPCPSSAAPAFIVVVAGLSCQSLLPT